MLKYLNNQIWKSVLDYARSFKLCFGRLAYVYLIWSFSFAQIEKLMMGWHVKQIVITTKSPFTGCWVIINHYKSITFQANLETSR